MRSYVMPWNLLAAGWLLTASAAWGQSQAPAPQATTLGVGQQLFNGQNLDGWAGDPQIWSVEGGVLRGRTTADAPLEHNTFLIWQGEVPSDFELRLQYRLEEGNSGIQYRSRVIDAERFIVGGYQADIDGDLTYTGINYEERGRGILAQRGQQVTLGGEAPKVTSLGTPQELASHIKRGDWNHYRVVAKGSRLQHFINEQLMCEVIDEQEDKRSTDGVIALQVHTGPPMLIEFREIVLRPLSH
jgi:hypothetical protein